MELIASPCSWSLSHQDVNVSYVRPCMLPGHASQEPFHRYGVRRYLVNRVQKLCTSQKQSRRSYFQFAPPPTPESPGHDRFKQLPTSGPEGLDLS